MARPQILPKRLHITGFLTLEDVLLSTWKTRLRRTWTPAWENLAASSGFPHASAINAILQCHNADPWKIIVIARGPTRWT